jgi:hypothetical protein
VRITALFTPAADGCQSAARIWRLPAVRMVADAGDDSEAIRR